MKTEASVSLAAKNDTTPRLLEEVVCPNCWFHFPPSQILWISRHEGLMGDPRLGPNEQLRFLPTTFNIKGNAFDPRGMECLDLACPRCHVFIPRSILYYPISYYAIIGTPGSGKSCFLACMSWMLRKTMISKFGMDFVDTDPRLNKTLHDYENALFLGHNRDVPVAMKDLIAKTQTTATDVHQNVYLDGQNTRLPKPFLFDLKPSSSPLVKIRKKAESRVICLYDTAGESFLPDAKMDEKSLDVTKYLAKASTVFFLYDPMQDGRFLDLMKKQNLKLPEAQTTSNRQDTVLREAISRVRRLDGANVSSNKNRILLFLLAKWDSWKELFKGIPDTPPTIDLGANGQALDMKKIKGISIGIEKILMKSAPELVAAARAFADTVYFLPVSALGVTPEYDHAHFDKTGEVRHNVVPRAINPLLVELPMLLTLARDSDSIPTDGSKV